MVFVNTVGKNKGFVNPLTPLPIPVSRRGLGRLAGCSLLTVKGLIGTRPVHHFQQGAVLCTGYYLSVQIVVRSGLRALFYWSVCTRSYIDHPLPERALASPHCGQGL